MADEYGSGSYDPAKDATAQEPLTDNEKKLVTRLFGDPFAFPMEYKAWLRGWLEEQFPRIGTLAVAAETGAAGAFVPPAGSILDYGGDTAPGGYVMCDGASYDKTSLVYQRLFTAIGYKFSSVSSGNLFQVPDLRGRMSVGKGVHADVDSVGDNEGAALGSRRPKHRHTVNDPTHTHGVRRDGTDEGFSHIDGADLYQIGSNNFDAMHYAATGITVGDPADALDTPPYLVVNKIISLGA